jgi:hypothetical protein
MLSHWAAMPLVGKIVDAATQGALGENSCKRVWLFLARACPHAQTQRETSIENTAPSLIKAGIVADKP